MATVVIEADAPAIRGRQREVPQDMAASREAVLIRDSSPANFCLLPVRTSLATNASFSGTNRYYACRLPPPSIARGE